MNALVYVEIDQGLHLGKNNVDEMKNEKTKYMGFRIPKIWKILKYFAGLFHQA